jgi:hypothetical protein
VFSSTTASNFRFSIHFCNSLLNTQCISNKLLRTGRTRSKRQEEKSKILRYDAPGDEGRQWRPDRVVGGRCSEPQTAAAPCGSWSRPGDFCCCRGSRRQAPDSALPIPSGSPPSPASRRHPLQSRSPQTSLPLVPPLLAVSLPVGARRRSARSGSSVHGGELTSPPLLAALPFLQGLRIKLTWRPEAVADYGGDCVADCGDGEELPGRGTLGRSIILFQGLHRGRCRYAGE